MWRLRPDDDTDFGNITDWLSNWRIEREKKDLRMIVNGWITVIDVRTGIKECVIAKKWRCEDGCVGEEGGGARVCRFEEVFKGKIVEIPHHIVLDVSDICLFRRFLTCVMNIAIVHQHSDKIRIAGINVAAPKLAGADLAILASQMVSWNADL